jgi:hypothetical protein
MARKKKPLMHGTITAYSYGCRCDHCKAANAEYRSRGREKRRGAEPPGHGTENAYSNYGCRCEECKQAHRSRPRKKAPSHGKEPPEHGTYNAYANYDCRCDDCKAAAHDRYVNKRGPTVHEQAEARFRELGLLGGE